MGLTCLSIILSVLAFGPTDYFLAGYMCIIVDLVFLLLVGILCLDGVYFEMGFNFCVQRSINFTSGYSM